MAVVLLILVASRHVGHREWGFTQSLSIQLFRRFSEDIGDHTGTCERNTG